MGVLLHNPHEKATTGATLFSTHSGGTGVVPAAMTHRPSLRLGGGPFVYRHGVKTETQKIGRPRGLHCLSV